MLHITALYASILALILLWLAYNVVVFRRKEKVDLGDGGSQTGIRHIRAQMNATEYVPITLLLFAVYEINGGSTYLLHALGALLVFCSHHSPFGVNQQERHQFWPILWHVDYLADHCCFGFVEHYSFCDQLINSHSQTDKL